MKINELILPKNQPTLKAGMHKIGSFSVENVIDMVTSLYNGGKSIKQILSRVHDEFGADAKSYVINNIASILKGSQINENILCFPSTNDQIKRLKLVFTKPIHPKDAKDVLGSILFSNELSAIIDNNKVKDVRELVRDYIVQNFPHLHKQLQPNDKDCLRNCDGTLSPLGQQDEKDYVIATQAID